MLVLVPHLFPSARLLEAAAQDLRLPALQTLLARGSRSPVPDAGVEAAVCEALGIARQQDWPVAPVALAVDGGDAGSAYWLRADPVHLRVMRDRVVLTDPRELRVSQDEADALAAAIGRHFGESLSPLPRAPQRWYLRLAHTPELTTTPLSLAVGRDIDPLLPQGRDGRQFRAQLNELQMLLHAHPVNEARAARGDPAVNALWLWGGGGRPTAEPTPVALWANDVEVRALGEFCRITTYPLPPRLEPALLRAPGTVVLLDALTPSGQYGDAYGWRHALLRLEADWFAPLLASRRLAGGSDFRIVDPVSGKALALRKGDAWKIWRRPRRLEAMLG